MEWIHEPVRLHEGKRFHFDRVYVRGRSGKAVAREMVTHPGAVCVLPVRWDEEGGARVVMIRNARFAVREVLYELPAGTREEGEPGIVTASRELMEESGYSAGSIEPLGCFYTTPGLTNELMLAYVAWDLEPVGQTLEDGEDIEVEEIGVSRVFEMIDQNEIMDSKSMLTLFLGARAGCFEPEWME